MTTTKIKGNASGSGSVTVTAPNTNSNRTLTLPDADVTLPNGLPGADAGYSKNVLSASGDILYASGANTLARLAKPGSDQFLKNTSGGTLSWATPASGGITVADQWRITSNESIDTTGEFLASNWAQINSTGQNTIGSDMSQSSGVFSFPSVGLYEVSFYSTGHSSSTEQDFIFAKIECTTNDSSYSDLSHAYQNCHSGGNVYYNVGSKSMFNVTSTSNCKVKFFMQCQSGTVTVHGSSSSNATYATFVRFGDNP